MTKSETINSFFEKKNIAIVGVSRKGKFGNAIYKEMKKNGYNVFAVNPNMQEFEGDKCYSNLKEIPEQVEAAVFAVSKLNCTEAARGAVEANIKNIWMQQGSYSKEAADFCKAEGINVIENECVFMFLEPVKHIHSFHRWLWKLIGKYPN